MNARRYVATSAREALERVRAELGPDAVILRNRAVEGGVEILAMPEGALAAPAFVETAREPAAPAGDAASSRPAPEPQSAGAMSTLSFGRYVNERRSRARVAGSASRADEHAGGRGLQGDGDARDTRRESAPAGLPGAPTQVQAATGMDAPEERAAAQEVGSSMLVRELRAMRGYLREQFESMAWVDSVRRSPVQVHLLTRMIDTGFSARLARALVARVPADYGDDEAIIWLHASLARNLDCVSGAGNPLADGGVFALVGPTGVGKTTTAAKIAAHCALRHGVDSVGLVTVDGYRIGAHEQLKSFGRLIGIPVHVARDAAGLGDALALLARKRLVLIDTAGVGQRDGRVGEVLGALDEGSVQRVTVLNAASQADTIDEVIDAYRAADGAGVVLSKVDETARLGGAIDAILRNRLSLLGVADGQRVPEDWHDPDAGALVARALEGRANAARRMNERELALLMSRIEPVAGAPADAGERQHV